MTTPKRLFIGLMADESVQAQLSAYQAQWSWPKGARLTPKANLHITLHFLGEVEQATTGRLVNAMSLVPPARFKLYLYQPGSFPGGIAFVEPLDSAPMHALQRSLGRAVVDAGLQLDARPWHPHVTLARKATGAQAPEAPAGIGWAVERFALVWSHGGRYDEIASWPNA